MQLPLDAGWFGCCGVKKVATIPAGVSAAATRLLQLSVAQLNRLHVLYAKTDVDRSNKISIPEFLALAGAKDTAFMRVLIDTMIFDWSDLNTDAKLDFSEFVLASCVVCTFSRDEMLHVLFKIFDSDGSGAISPNEFGKIAEAVASMGSMFPGSLSHKKSRVSLFRSLSLSLSLSRESTFILGEK